MTALAVVPAAAPPQLPAVDAVAKFDLMQRKARLFASSPLIPEHLRKDGPEKAMANCYIALTMAEALNENPLTVLQNLTMISGKAGFAAQYMIARANASGMFKGGIGWRVDRSNPQNLSVTAFAHMKETGEEISITVDMAMAQAEGWTKNAKYRTMPEVMLRYRSAAFLVRFYAPHVMLGYHTSEELEDLRFAAATPVADAPQLTGAALLEQAGIADATVEPAAEAAPPRSPAGHASPAASEPPQHGADAGAAPNGDAQAAAQAKAQRVTTALLTAINATADREALAGVQQAHADKIAALAERWPDHHAAVQAAIRDRLNVFDAAAFVYGEDDADLADEDGVVP